MMLHKPYERQTGEEVTYLPKITFYNPWEFWSSVIIQGYKKHVLDSCPSQGPLPLKPHTSP